jgi:hypothetical protein
VVYFEDDGEALCARQPLSLGTHVLVEVDEVVVPLSVQSREEQEDEVRNVGLVVGRLVGRVLGEECGLEDPGYLCVRLEDLVVHGREAREVDKGGVLWS